jgi:hypothetical protein
MTTEGDGVHCRPQSQIFLFFTSTIGVMFTFDVFECDKKIAQSRKSPLDDENKDYSRRFGLADGRNSIKCFNTRCSTAASQYKSLIRHFTFSNFLPLDREDRIGERDI